MSLQFHVEVSENLMSLVILTTITCIICASSVDYELSCNPGMIHQWGKIGYLQSPNSGPQRVIDNLILPCRTQDKTHKCGTVLHNLRQLAPLSKLGLVFRTFLNKVIHCKFSLQISSLKTYNQRQKLYQSKDNNISCKPNIMAESK